MKRKFIITSLILFILIFLTVIPVIYATGPLDEYDTDNIPSGAMEGMEKTQKIINRTITIVQLVGLFAAVAMLVIMGMKFMLGSIEDKVEVKKHLSIYILGAVILFGTGTILQVVKDVVVGSLEG